MESNIVSKVNLNSGTVISNYSLIIRFCCEFFFKNVSSDQPSLVTKYCESLKLPEKPLEIKKLLKN